MPSLSNIVDIQVTRETRGISQVGFGTPMVLGQHTRFVERTRIYEEVDAMLADGFLTSDAEYKAVNAIFAQELRPVQVVVGRRLAKVAQVSTVTIATVANSFAYTVTINGVQFTFTSDVDATDLEIQAGLIAAINAGSEPVTAAAVSTNQVSLTADVAGNAFTAAVGTNLTLALTTANVGVIEDLAACRDENDDWYMLCLTSRDKNDILNAASAIESLRKMFIGCSEDSDVIAATAGNVADELNDRGYDRSAYMWSDDQENYPEAAWMGRVLPLDPGSETWKFKALAGIEKNTLNATQRNNVLTYKGNLYSLFAGVGITEEGTVASGEYIDVIRFIDWLEARMQEDIFGALVNSKKIPYTDQGIAVIESLVRARLEAGIRVGGLAADPAYIVDVPRVANISQNDKAARLLPDVKFQATLAGAIHKVQIRGRVTL